MKRIIYTTSLIFNILCVVILGYVYLDKSSTPNIAPVHIAAQEKQSASDGKPFKVAVFTPSTHPSLEKIQEGFCDGLVKKYGLNCSFDVYNANGNRTLMHAQAEEIVQNSYDLIFTIGAMTTQMAKEVSLKKHNLTPIVFGLVARPEKLNLVESREKSGNHLTGLTADPDYHFQMNMLHFLKPDIKKILLVYDPTQSSGLEYDKNVVEEILTNLGISLTAVEVYKTNEVYSKISALVDTVDAVLIFKDNTVVSSIDSLIKLCNRAGVPLCTTDLDSVPKGAAIGFSVTSYDAGVETSQKAYAILAEGKSPSQIPITQAECFKTMINEKAMELQKFTVGTHLKQLITSIEVIR